MANGATARKRFYSVEEVGERWGKERRTIIRAIEAGKLRAVRLANRGAFMIPRGEVERWEHGEPAVPAAPRIGGAA
jgi:excisionase family DNA binding protein